jgi:protein SCO1/2
MLAFTLVAGCSPAYQMHGSPYQDPQPAPELYLDTTEADEFSLNNLHGKVVLLYFGYTHCPDICPATMAQLKWVTEQLGSQSDQVQVLFVSIDPDRDDPQTIRSFLDRFNPEFIGLSAPQTKLEPVLASYGVAAQRDPGESENYTMSHTSRVFLIDREGTLQTNYTYDESRANILADVQYFLAH